MLPLSLGHKHHRGLADLPRACWGGYGRLPRPRKQGPLIGPGSGGLKQVPGGLGGPRVWKAAVCHWWGRTCVVPSGVWIGKGREAADK